MENVTKLCVQKVHFFPRISQIYGMSLSKKQKKLINFKLTSFESVLAAKKPDLFILDIFCKISKINPTIFLNIKFKFAIFLNCRKTKFLMNTNHINYQLTFPVNPYCEKLEKVS